jgi:hypothetical protein
MIVNINDCNACWEELPPSSEVYDNCSWSRSNFAHTFLDIDDIKNLLSNLEVSVLVLNEIWETILSTYKHDGGDIYLVLNLAEYYTS